MSAADRAHAAKAPRACRYGDGARCLARLPYGSFKDALDSAPRSAATSPRTESYIAAIATIYAACARMLAPGGFQVLVMRDMRSGGALRNLTGDAIRLCQAAGLAYWQHVIALLATVRESELRALPSFWQLLHVRQALAKGEPIQLTGHEDVVVLRLEIQPGSR